MALACVGVLQNKRIRGLRERIADANRTDPLTGLLNRRAFEELLELELDRATRAGRPLSVVVGDIDGFRAINEREGHAAGDATLQAVAQNALKWKRRIDHAARIGGEEFALLLPETDERGAFIVAERLRRAVHRSFVDASTGVNFSFGVATAPSHGEDAVELLRAAGHDEIADRITTDLVGRNVIAGRWTFQVVEEYDDGYYAAFRQLERLARDTLAGGRRHLYEAELKEQRRSHGRPGHEARPS